MISRLEIDGYKKFKHLVIDRLGTINVFLGPNNMGKTSILESIYGWASGQNLQPFFDSGITRSQFYARTKVYAIAEAILSSVNRNSDENKLSFTFAAIENGKKISFKHEFVPSVIFQPLEWIPFSQSYEYAVSEARQMFLQDGQPNFFIGKWSIYSDLAKEQVYEICSDNRNNTTQYFGIQSHIPSYYYKGYFYDVIGNMQIYNSLKRRGLLDKFITGLKKNFPYIKSLDAIPYPDSTFGYVNVEKEDGSSLPIYSYGDGLQKWYSILGEMIKSTDGMMCIDEIDAAFHPEMQRDFSRYLLDYAKLSNIQVFATTHNIEWVDKLLHAYNNDELEEYIRIYKIFEDDNGIPKIKCLTGDEAAYIRREYNMELR